MAALPRDIFSPNFSGSLEVLGRSAKSAYPSLLVSVDGKRFRTAEHTFLMQMLMGRALLPDEVVHHINGDPSDNRVTNLYLCTRSVHARIHGRQGDRVRGRRRKSCATQRVGLLVPCFLRDQIEAAAKADDFTNTSEWIRIQLVRRCREVLADDAPTPARAAGGGA